MPILGTLLKGGIKLRSMVESEKGSPFALQKKTFLKLVYKASDTLFGKQYRFDALLETLDHADPRRFYKDFCAQVPIHDYNKIFADWWYRTLEGEYDVCWPGKVKYFALSSGTSDAASKYIPVTRDMTKAIQKVSTRQILSLGHYHLPASVFEKGILMLGGSTNLQYNGIYYQGDLSGIQASKIPAWFHRFYKPGKAISRYHDWNDKLDEITQQAADWDIGVIVGVPAWVQILMEKIIAHYKVANIHEIWPNLTIYTHGGVSMEPYRRSFEKLLGKPIHYIETYLASEGFIAYQSRPNQRAMEMALDVGIFFEFIPFTDNNFDADGNLKPNAETLMIDEVEEDTEYAILISTCAGAWRYLIGDVVKFTDVEAVEIVITGRTKHYISLCGEHLSVVNMTEAIKRVSDELDLEINEFCMAGVNVKTLFGHRWFVGTDKTVDNNLLAERIDHHLKILNDDYRTERSAALIEVTAMALPNDTFNKYLEMKGKIGSQNKFPRVLKKKMLEEWESFLKSQNIN